ncbi:MAG: 6-phosphogluconolactonase [Burkholderiales bacterium]
MNSQICRWHIYPTAQNLEINAAHAIFRIASQAILEHGAFSIVLAGGNTPKAIYQRLSVMPADWRHWHVYFGDERCVPDGHAERNSSMALTSWLGHVPIPPQQIHVIPAENGPQEGAREYCVALNPIEDFDLVLLGLGEDGHTASLFPGHEWGVEADAPAAIAVTHASKSPGNRVSLSAARLSRARQVLFFVAGASKSAAVKSWRSGGELSARAICPPGGVEVLADESAFGV